MNSLFSFPIVPFIALLACLCGLWVAVYIHRKKRTKTKLICPLRANCDKVIHSTHSTVFGIPNELLGIAYYIILGSIYALIVIYPEMFSTPGVHYVILLMTMGGVLFSIYLVALQAVVIRAWCSWCMVSAIANVVLALCLFKLPLEEFFQLLASHYSFWIIIHSLGFILGIGAATITDVFFFRFMKDHQISEGEKGTLETLTNVIWVGLAILVISGLMLFLPDRAQLSTSPKFLLKMTVVIAIIINGIALNLYVSPRMRQLSFESTKPARHFRRLAFALGGISIVSWYTAFILGSMRNVGHYSFTEGLIGYAILVVCVVIGSQIFERLAVRGYHALPDTDQN